MASTRKSVSLSIGKALATLDPAEPSRPLAVAFSGGLDSTVLLAGCCAAAGADSVVALHVHHGLQAAADAWPAHCEAQARRLGARFISLRAEGTPAAGENTEAWARAQRYRLLLDAARRIGATALLTAHHADDQLETLLMAIDRGCGLDGLTGIAEIDRRDGVTLLRPLLDLTRADIAEAAQQRQLGWVEDPTNADKALLRNAIRQRVLPAIVEVLPRLLDRLPDTIALLSQARAVIDEVADADLMAATAIDSPRSAIDRRVLAALSPLRQANALRAWVGRLGERPPSQAKLLEMRAQFVTGTHAYGEVRHGELRLVRYRDRLLAWRSKPDPGDASLVPDLEGPLPEPVGLRWHGETRLSVPGFGGSVHVERPQDGAGGIDPDWLQSQLLRMVPGRASARLRPRAGGPSRTLKNLYQEHGVPPSLRAWFPMIEIGGRLLLAAPFGIDRSPQWPVDPHGVALHWEPGSPRDPRCLFVALQDV